MKTLRELAGTCGMTIRVFFMDEARFGQQGTTTRVWAKTGSRPTALKQLRYEWMHMFAAIEPTTGKSVAWQSPYMNTTEMNRFLRMVSDELGPRDHAVLIMDRAGWHRSKALCVPDNITILYLPPYSPELNPVERVWAYLRSHYLANRAYDDYNHILAATADAWNELTDVTLKTLCACPYLTHEIER